MNGWSRVEVGTRWRVHASLKAVGYPVGGELDRAPPKVLRSARSSAPACDRADSRSSAGSPECERSRGERVAQVGKSCCSGRAYLGERIPMDGGTDSDGFDRSAWSGPGGGPGF